MNEQERIEDRRRGCFWGLFVGDALGMPLEGTRGPWEQLTYTPRRTYSPVTGYRDGWLPSGHWTDDGAMALALATSIAERGWDLRDQMNRYLDWAHNGAYSSIPGKCVDIGGVTASALDEYQFNFDPLTSGQTHERSAANGCIMRLAPVPVRYLDKYVESPTDVLEMCEQSSRVTHSHPDCLLATKWLGSLLCELILGDDSRETLLTSDIITLQEIGPLLEVFRGSYRSKEPPEIAARGGVVATMEAALWAFHDAPDFKTAVLKAVNLGRDADTVGAVCGQLAGAYWGLSGIPEEWISGLARRDAIEYACERLLAD